MLFVQKEKNLKLIYEVAPDVHFGHEFANREFWSRSCSTRVFSSLCHGER
jgi:hypothetical protein